MHRRPLILPAPPPFAAGCCFLTYCAREPAERAVALLHNKHRLPNATNPLQVRVLLLSPWISP